MYNYLAEDCINSIFSYLSNEDLNRAALVCKFFAPLAMRNMDWDRPRPGTPTSYLEHIISEGLHHPDLIKMIEKYDPDSYTIISWLMRRKKDELSPADAKIIFSMRPYAPPPYNYFDLLGTDEYINHPLICINILGATLCTGGIVKSVTINRILASPRAADVLDTISNMGPVKPKITIHNLVILVNHVEPAQLGKLLKYANGASLYNCINQMLVADEAKIAALVDYFKPARMTEFPRKHLAEVERVVTRECKNISARQVAEFLYEARVSI